MKANYFIFDEQKCVACHACILACDIENNNILQESWRKVVGRQKGNQGLPSTYISMACNHCDDAPCLINCPSNAIYMDEKSNAVLIREESCIGCGYCAWNCPYEAPVFNDSKGIMEKCNMCNGRVEKGIEPACCSLCPTSALSFSFEKINKKEIPQHFSLNKNPHPSLTFIEKKETEQLFDPHVTILHYQKESKPLTIISLRKEWPLIVFTILCAFTVGSISLMNNNSYNHTGLLLFSTGIIAGLASFFHLGKKARFLLAFKNIRHSWLSREIFFYSLFMLVLFIDLTVVDMNFVVHLVTGSLLLVSIDKLYAPLQQSWRTPIHSGMTLFIALALILMFTEATLLLIMLLSVRFILAFVHRQGTDQGSTWILRIIRMSSIVILLILMAINIGGIALWLILVAGEIVDRILYYKQLHRKTLAEL